MTMSNSLIPGTSEASPAHQLHLLKESLLEGQCRAYLEVARRVRAAGGPETSILQVGIKSVEVHLVEKIERVQSKIEIEAANDLGALLQTDVRLGKAGISELIADLLVAKVPKRGNREFRAGSQEVLTARKCSTRSIALVCRSRVQHGRTGRDVRQVVVVAARAEVATSGKILQVGR